MGNKLFKHRRSFLEILLGVSICQRLLIFFGCKLATSLSFFVLYRIIFWFGNYSSLFSCFRLFLLIKLFCSNLDFIWKYLFSQHHNFLGGKAVTLVCLRELYSGSSDLHIILDYLVISDCCCELNYCAFILILFGRFCSHNITNYS